MATLDALGVLSYNTLKLGSARQVVSIWHLELKSSSDTLTVPGLSATTSVASLTNGISVSAGALTNGDNTLTITGGTAGTKCVIACLHRDRISNNLSRDNSPGV